MSHGLDIWYDKNAFQTYSNDLVNVHMHQDYTSNMHKHEFYEINIIASGSGTHILDGVSYACQKGDVFIVPPFVPHQCISDSNFDVYNMMISTLWIKNFTEELDSLNGFYPLFSVLPLFRSDGELTWFLHLLPEDYETLDGLLLQSKKMFHAKSAQPPFCTAYRQTVYSFLSGSALSIVSYLCYCYTRYEKDSMLGPDGGANAFAKSLLYIYSHYNEKISVEQLAKYAAMSYSTYNRVFKEKLHCSPLSYINHYRVAVAKNYLKRDIPLADIASLTGFFDHSHFIKMFTKIAGVTPAEYKKQLKENEESRPY